MVYILRRCLHYWCSFSYNFYSLFYKIFDSKTQKINNKKDCNIFYQGSHHCISVCEPFCLSFFIGKGGNGYAKQTKEAMCLSRLSESYHDTYCEEHEALRQKQYDRYSRAHNCDKKYGNNWRRIRANYVKSHPLCERCLKEGMITPVEEVHHIIPLSRGGTNQFCNLMPLCQSCHTKIHYELGDRK